MSEFHQIAADVVADRAAFTTDRALSEFHQIAADVVADRAAFTTDPVSNLTKGTTFTAEIEGNIDAIIIQSELGEDCREAVLLHVASQSEAAQIGYGDRVQFTLFGQTSTHRIVKRRQNVGNPNAQFWAVKLVEGKDA